MLLRAATTVEGTQVDVRIDGLRLDAVEPAGTLTPRPAEEVHDLAGWLLLPAPAEPHAHLDKALTADQVLNPAGDLDGAIRAWHAHWTELTVDDIAGRARAAALRCLTNGTTALRSHVDVSGPLGLTAVEGLLRVQGELADLIDVQVVALVSIPVTGSGIGAEQRALLREALDMGADVGGGCPHLDPDPAEALDICLSAAADHGRPIDLHTDETLEPSILGVRSLAAEVARTGFPYGATASHCVSLGVQPAGVQQAVAEELAAAGVAVVTLPQTNLFLQGRAHSTSVPRGLTALRALHAAGVVVAAGGDNLQDPFNLMGRADALETASLLVTAGHLTPSEAWQAISAGSRAAMGLPPVAVVAGAPAELLAVRSRSLREVIAEAPADRLVVHRGRVVARTTLSVETAW